MPDPSCGEVSSCKKLFQKILDKEKNGVIVPYLKMGLKCDITQVISKLSRNALKRGGKNAL